MVFTGSHYSLNIIDEVSVTKDDICLWNASMQDNQLLHADVNINSNSQYVWKGSCHYTTMIITSRMTNDLYDWTSKMQRLTAHIYSMENTY